MLHIWTKRGMGFMAALILGMGLGLTACDETHKGDVLASIDELSVTEAHFVSAFKRYYYRSGQVLEPSFEVKSSVLNSEFNTLVLATYAKDLGMADGPEGKRRKDMIYRRVLTEEYMDAWLNKNAMITENDMREAFGRYNTQIRASHLYAPDQWTADSLYQLLQDGVSFDQLAADIFRNPRLANTGGDLGIIRMDETDPAFEKMAFAMEEGEISEPVRTAQGYSIIKVTQKTSKPIATETEYASVKDRMAYFADKMKKELAKREHMFSFIESLKINETAVRSLSEKVDAGYSAFSSLDPEFFSSLESDEILVSKDGYDLNVSEFADEAYLTPLGNLNRISDEAALINLIRGIAYRNYMVEIAEKQGLNNDGEVQASIDQSFYTYLAEQSIERIRRSIEISDEDLLDYYSKNTDRFVKPLEMNLSRIVVGDEETAGKIHQMLMNGSDFGALVDEYTIKNEERLTNGELGYAYVQDYGLLSPKLSILETGEVSDPLFYQSGEYHIYKVLGRKESKLLRFGEARSLVRETLIEEELERELRKTLEEVKQKHNAVVDEQKLRELTIQI
ncbi:peptidyl-prolyl cis-trans isomerase [Balneola sp. MJW-20]|uniref:peptidyl-prolyl cis-trans isomerase n=1 Tax=Gracilimonas aurantiaca TaxID=3234185 RepID=UPI0034679EAC